MSTTSSSLTPNELIALEAYAQFGDGYPIKGASEVLRRCRETDPSFAVLVARSLYEWASKSDIIRLAQQMVSIHKEHSIAELSARTDLTSEQAEQIITALPKPNPEPIYSLNWSPTAAREWLMSYARSLSSEAKYIRENADGFAENEEEFRCGLANGLGIDGKEEQTEIIRKFMKESKT